MPRLRIPGAAATALLAAFAQPAAPAPDSPTARGPATPAAEAGQQQQAQEGRRSSQIVGMTVYNDRDERIGTVDDLIVGQDGRISEAVLSVGGFLGLGAKLVAVPYDQLRFEPRTADRITDGPTPAARVAAPVVPDPREEARWRTNPGAAAPVEPAPEAGGGPGTAPPVARLAAGTRLVLPGATQASLRSLPEFNYGH
jgi:sporulation protein YlmC with PRC-barrel domain